MAKRRRELDNALHTQVGWIKTVSQRPWEEIERSARNLCIEQEQAVLLDLRNHTSCHAWTIDGFGRLFPAHPAHPILSPDQATVTVRFEDLKSLATDMLSDVLHHTGGDLSRALAIVADRRMNTARRMLVECGRLPDDMASIDAPAMGSLRRTAEPRGEAAAQDADEGDRD
jgi:hypothetical protein